MTTALEAIHGELATMRLRVRCLEQAEALLGPAYDPTAPPRSPRPKRGRPKRAARRVSHRNPTRAEVLAHVIAHAPITRGELIAALGCHPKTMDNRLRSLLKDGEIEAEGRSGARRYRSPETPGIVPLPPVGSGTRLASQPPPDHGVYPMYDAILSLGGATTEQLTRETGLPTNLVVEQGRRLIQLGLVRFTGVGKARLWLPTQSEIVRDAA
jgi:hypothetical protein